MRTYIFKVVDHCPKRGYNQTITVYRIKRNIPQFIGTNGLINTASTYGPHAEARQIAQESGEFKMLDSYNAPEGVQFFEL